MAEATSNPAARPRAIREMPPAERPRERLAARGAAGLSAAELIALIWGSGSAGRSAVDLAEDAIARHDGLTGLARATDVELEAVPGIGARRRPSWRPRSSSAGGCSPTGRRRAGRSARRRDVADRLVLQMGRLEREELRVVLLNTKNVVLRVATVYQGNVVVVARPGRRAVPGRRPAQRGRHDPRPQPPVAATRRRRPTTST